MLNLKLIFYRYFSHFLIGFIIFYIYVISLSFLYSYHSEMKIAREIESSPVVHEHDEPLDLSMKTKREIMEYRQKRFRQAQLRQQKDGPGEGGVGVYLTGEEAELGKKLFKKETFNVVASNKISMDRHLNDARPEVCKDVTYPKHLPNASVIMVFCNEAPSALLRTVHSVVNRSPPEYLHEIILVDDASERPNVGADLDKYIARKWPDGVVRVVRSKKRLGLIKGKMLGAREASGEVLIFLDAHCEATYMWIEPILARIKEDRTVVLCPMIDSIDDNTLQYHYGGGLAVGGFSWSLHFTWRGVPRRDLDRRRSEAEPVRSPTMAGGLFAAERKFFFDTGGYDEGMEVWGGENLEISFRTWMCGGSLEFHPCSRVGHIFRAAHPYSFLQKDTHGLNSKRLAEVWMDDYKRLYYLHRKDLENSDAGDYSNRVALRNNLHCRSFKWYLDNVYPEKFVPDEGVHAYGMLWNPSTHLCLDTLGKDEHHTISVGLFSCQGGASSSELFSYTKRKELRREEMCCDCMAVEGATVSLRACHGSRGAQEWLYNKTTLQMQLSGGQFCLDVDGLKNSDVIKVRACDVTKNSQKWTFEHTLTDLTG